MQLKVYHAMFSDKQENNIFLRYLVISICTILTYSNCRIVKHNLRFVRDTATNFDILYFMRHITFYETDGH